MSALVDRVNALLSRPTTICRKCGKRLRDPNSIEHGMGPICQGKIMAERTADRLAGRRANYAVIDEDEKRVLIKDLGPWDQYLTATNAAESVVAELAGRLKGRELHYIDSEGAVDQLLVVGGKFAGFKPIQEEV